MIHPVYRRWLGLPMRVRIAWAAAAVAVAWVCAGAPFPGRYQMGRGAMERIDTWTGNVQIFAPQKGWQDLSTYYAPPATN